MTDNGLKELAAFTNLKFLGLSGQQFTDAGLKVIAEHKNLTSLYLQNTKVSKTAADELRRMLPKCIVYLSR